MNNINLQEDARNDIFPTLDEIEASTLEEARTNWCLYAQRILENYAKADIPANKVKNIIYTDSGEFIRSKPTVDNGIIYLSTYYPSAQDVEVGYEQIWCKLNTAEKLNQELGICSQGERCSHSRMNNLALKWAFNYVDAQTQAAYKKANIHIDYQQTKKLTGLTWSSSELNFTKTNNNIYTLETTYLRTGNLLIESLSYKHYCKLLSPKGAIDFIQEVARNTDPLHHD
jgi:hypothetical protein